MSTILSKNILARWAMSLIDPMTTLAETLKGIVRGADLEMVYRLQIHTGVSRYILDL